MKRAFVFPGQGSQHPGMGRDLAEAFTPARLLFQEVDDALSQNLSRLMFEGPESDLTLTENAQPALLAASLAVIRVLEAEGGFDIAKQIAYVAGHSLGEYSAHAAAGTVSVADAVRLVKRRGQAMQKAVPVGEGAMAALLGLDIEAAREVAAGTTVHRAVAQDVRGGRLTHWILYGLMIVTVTLGVSNAWARGDSIFNLFKIPQLVPGDHALVQLIGDWHALGANAIMIVAGLHAAAALFHHYVLRDATLRRMRPWARR
jgi:Acyl transferase domain/Prokaryotic cytochrome b561